MKNVKYKIHYYSSEVIQDNITGKGITVAILDTGISRHPELTGRIIGWQDMIRGKKQIYDDCGHGTHVAGIIGASGIKSGGDYSGIAPGAMIVAVKVLDKKGGGKIENVIRGIQYVLKEQQHLGIKIVNISIGALPHVENEDEQKLLYWVERLWDAGMVVVTAAGNLGPDKGSITIPGISRKVITVGACEEVMHGDEIQKKKTMYSGCGPTKECIKKPDVSAPGNGIYSCNYQYPFASSLPYIKKNGTSMATPVISGAVALLLEKYPDMNNVEVKLRIWESCEDIGLPRNRQGHGRIDLRKLLA